MSHPSLQTTAAPVYALSKSGRALLAASLHPWGGPIAVERARVAGAEVSADATMVDGEWLKEDVRACWPDMVAPLEVLIIAVFQQGMMLDELTRQRAGGKALAN